jgi:hypothetical protein
MDSFNAKLDTILKNKEKEILILSQEKAKNKKMITNTDIDCIPYAAKTTMYKIQAEQEKKLKNSKAYKNKEQMFET